MNQVNSFSQTVADLTANVNIALESLIKTNEAITTQNDSVVVEVNGNDPVTGDPSTYYYSIPSYNFTINRLNTISDTVDTFVNGRGVVLLNDGTYREVKTIPLSIAPPRITDVQAPTTFRTRPNWFFESLLFPATVVQFDLKDKIDDRSDRVQVKRVLFDNFDDTETQWFLDNFVGQTYTYSDAITLLNQNNKRYWEDEDIIDLPLQTNEYDGEFLIINKGVVDNNEWYYLDTLNYGLVTDTSTVKNLELKVADQLRFGENTLYSIDEIVVTEKRVRLTPLIGLATPNLNGSFFIYSTPFEEKLVDIQVGYDECNIIFLKGVNDDFNVLGSEWSESISFWTNNLTLYNNVKSYETFYLNNVIDFGKEMEGQAKERFVPAFFGVTPDAPTIVGDQFGVDQINTQINASLDTEAIKTTQTQIESTKTIINSLKSTIAQQKAELVELTDAAARSDLQGKINNNISELSKQTVEYQSLTRSLTTVAYENDAVINNPKYRVRGFFDIPAPKRLTTDPNERPQEIIQFDVAYRYLRLDGTGNPLSTHSYADPSSGQTVTGTFTDWTITQSPIKTKVYDASTDQYVWANEQIENGQEVNINQVDVPITKGEIVEIRLRSISEAGWPNNPVKSEWSETVQVEFPANLSTSDQVANILADAQQEETTIKLDETLESAGVITHLNDSVPNPNSGDGTYFKHQSQFLEYTVSVKDVNGIVTSQYSTDLQAFLDNMPNLSYVTLTKPAGATDPAAQKTVTLQSLFQAIVDADATIYDNL